MFKSRHMVVTAALILVAAGAMASNFRAADQVYVPVSGHLTAGSGTFVSDIFISNVTSDAVTVSVIYTRTTNLSGDVQPPQYFNNLFTLAANERRELNDFLGVPAPAGLGLSNAFGTLIFNGCRQGADCTVNQDVNGGHVDFRDIAVLSRIYLIPTGQTPATAATTGQDIPGIPWYHYASSRASVPFGLGRLAITGFRQTGTAGQAGTYRGNLGVMNASQFSRTTLLLRLYTGSNRATHIAERRVNLGPLNHIQAGISDLFQVVAGPQTTNLYVTIEQENSIAEPGAPSTCGTDGCPGFLAYGAVLDNVTGDATTLEAIYEKALTGDAITAIYGKTGNTPNYRRIVRRNP